MFSGDLFFSNVLREMVVSVYGPALFCDSLARNGCFYVLASIFLRWSRAKWPFSCLTEVREKGQKYPWVSGGQKLKLLSAILISSLVENFVVKKCRNLACPEPTFVKAAKAQKERQLRAGGLSGSAWPRKM
jgi:hypothetical protein